jgi:acyl-CoA reductase-like NAD-dependent aldehyde dehydrogenase
LSGAVWSATDERAVGVADQLRTGEVYINGGRFNIEAPFGGVGQSGYGRELGPYGVREFTYLRALHFR